MRINFVLPLVLAAGLVGHAAEPHPEPFIVRISEQWSTLQPTAGPNNVGNCLIVMPGGRLHLELRRQEFFDGRVVWTTYESALDGRELGILRSILNDAAVRTLRPFAQPVVPMNSDDSQTFTAEIVRGSQVQRVGYLSWHGIAPNNPEADKIAWKKAGDALQRLVEWSHEIKSSKALNWRRVSNPNTTCGQ
jgi:hypothetical protein